MIGHRWLPARTLATTLMVMLIGLGIAGMAAGDAWAQKGDDPTRPVSSLDEAVKNGRIARASVDAAAKHGLAPVIVYLRLPGPYRPEGKLSGAQIEQQRQAIRRGQDALLKTVAGARTTAIKRYQFIPHLALRADTRALTALVASRDVLVVEEDTLGRPTLPNSTKLIGAGNVHSATGAAGGGWAVAIIDTGVDDRHPALAGKIAAEACYSTDWVDQQGTVLSRSTCPGGSNSTAAGSGRHCPGCAPHGTSMAGIAAGSEVTFGGTPIAGVAPDAAIVAVQVFSEFQPEALVTFNPCGQGICRIPLESDVLLGLERVHALHPSLPIAAVNASLSLGLSQSNQPCDLLFPAVKNAVDLLRSVGIATVASAGNLNEPDKLVMPACLSSAISVGYTRRQPAPEVIGPLSSSASFLSLLAPGAPLTFHTLFPQQFTNGDGGTSAAAAHVTGAWALLRSLFPQLSVDQILDALTSTGTPIPDPRNGFTKPRIQLDAAVESLSGSLLAPSDVRLTNVQGTRLNVLWTDNSFGEAKFLVRATPQSPLLGLRHAEVGPNATSATLTNLHPNRIYTILVKACDAANHCTDSAPVTATTRDTLPAAPTNLRSVR